MELRKLIMKAFVSTIVMMVTCTLLLSQKNVLDEYNLFELKNVAEVSVSPTGEWIAYSVIVPRPFNDTPGVDYRELFVYHVKTGKTTDLITGKRSMSGLNWSPDGKKITFRYSGPQSSGIQVYAIDPKGGDPYPVTFHTRSINSYEFINNDLLAIVSAEPQSEKKSNLLKKGFDAEIFEEEFQHLNLYLYHLKTNEVSQVTSGVTVFDFTISPDGKFAAAAIAQKNLVDYSYMFKRIFLVNLETGELTKLLDNPGKLGKLVWSPDGKKLAFLSASGIHDSVVGSLFVIDVPNHASFEELRNYAEGMRASIVNLEWKDNNTLLFVSEEGVDMVLSEQMLTANSRKILIEPGNIVFRSFSRQGDLLAFTANTAAHPNELYTYSLRKKQFQRITNLNPWLSEIKMGKQEKIIYDARDGLDIEGVLVYPTDYEAGKRYPLITYIHGGPESAIQNGWVTRYNLWGQIAAARGYFVFLPNYRAGSGRGVDFTMEGFADLVGKEYEDVLDGIDHLIEKGYVDKNKVGIGGGSYGGYFSCWSATRYTERFAAAVSFVGISNQISKRNTTDIPWEDYLVHWGFWTHENMEKVWDASPIKFAPGSKTPLLLLHGKEDPRVPPSQSLELYRKLKIHGQAPVRLVWYPGQGHGNSKNTSRLDYTLRTMQWFDYYLKDLGPKDEMPEKYIEFKID
jgi:dipeptidyl aminopeptidase/acylaminoacyl peptidase